MMPDHPFLILDYERLPFRLSCQTSCHSLHQLFSRDLIPWARSDLLPSSDVRKARIDHENEMLAFT